MRALFSSLAVAAALAPATARAQGAADQGKDMGRFLDNKRPEQNQLKREIDVSVEDADLREVMDIIGRRVGKNIVVEPEIHEKVTISLRKIPWRDAVDVIAKMTKCEVETRGQILVLTQPPKVTIQFTDANVRTVLQLLANYSGKNIIISPEVRGDVTVDLHEVNWLKALYAIVGTVPGDFQVVEDTPDLLRVVPRSSILQQLHTVSIPLKYLRPPVKYLATPPRTSVGTGGSATGAANLFIGSPKPPTGDAANEFTLYRALTSIVKASAGGPAGAAGSAIDYDQQKNAFIVRGTQPLIDELKSIIDKLDQEPAQIYVEVRFISTSDDSLLDYGIQPDNSTTGLSFDGPFPTGQTNTVGDTSHATQNGTIVPDTIARNLGTFPFMIGTNAHQTFEKAFALPAVLDFRGLNYTLNLLQTDTRSRLLQTPSLFMMDNEDAVIFVGEDVPFAQVNSTPDINGNVVQSIAQATGSPIAIGFSLFISPHCIPDTDKIMLTVIPRVSSPGGTSGDENIFDTFTIGTQSIQLPHTREQTLVTHMMLDDGNTAVIGGLLTESDTEIIIRTPILSSIPILGSLFTHTHREKEVNNLLILITATIIRSKPQSVALYKKADALAKRYDHFYQKYEKPKADEEAKKAAASGAPAPAPDPAALPAPAGADGPGGTAPSDSDNKKQ